MAKDDNDFYLSFRVWGTFVRSKEFDPNVREKERDNMSTSSTATPIV